ncbi:MAG: TlpA family protein disulfide reductase [Bacteroidia bacterium]
MKKHWSNILFGIFLILLLVPQTGKPIKVFVHRLISFSPSELSEQKRETLTDYNWVLVNEAGEKVDFNQYKGKVVVLNHWATWCAPCVAEMPSLQELYDSRKDEISFLFVSNEEPSVTSGFKASQEYTFPVFGNYSAPPELLQSSSIPATYIIDKNGVIRVRKIGAADWNSKKVNQLLTDLSKAE